MPFFCNCNLSQNLTVTALTAEFNATLSNNSHPRMMLKVLQNARFQGSTIPVPRYKSNNCQGWSALGLQGQGGRSETGLFHPVHVFPYSGHIATQVGPLGTPWSCCFPALAPPQPDLQSLLKPPEQNKAVEFV